MCESVIRSLARALVRQHATTRVRRIFVPALGLALLAAGASAAVINVPADFPTIQQAIDAASDGDQIFVAPGTYLETIDFLGKRLEVIGTGGAGVTTIDANFAGSAVTARGNEPAGTLIRGFTLTHGAGQALVAGPYVGVITGGGILVEGAATHLRAESCVITANTLAGGSGAAAVEMSDATVELHGCTVAGNTSPGGSAIRSYAFSTPTSLITGCSVAGNTAPVAVLGLIVVEDSSFLGNSGTGHDVGLGNPFSSPKLKRCVFKDNAVGVNVFSFTSTALSDCMFLGNGIGASVVSSSDGLFAGVSVRNCIFVADSLFASASGGSFGPPAVAVINCTFDGAEITVPTLTFLIKSSILRHGTDIVSPAPAVSFSNVQGGAPGTGNINADPLWVDPVALDYRLQPGSPCINTGGGSGVPLDADGSPPDMGAIPYDPFTDLGGGVSGASGPCVLEGAGSLLAGTTLTLELTAAPPSQPVTLILGASQLGVPFKGGTLWPQLDVTLGFVTDGAGALSLSGPWPAGIPSAFSLWSQVWFADPTAPQNFAASNGLKATTP